MGTQKAYATAYAGSGGGSRTTGRDEHKRLGLLHRALRRPACQAARPGLSLFSYPTSLAQRRSSVRPGFCPSAPGLTRAPEWRDLPDSASSSGEVRGQHRIVDLVDVQSCLRLPDIPGPGVNQSVNQSASGGVRRVVSHRGVRTGIDGAPNGVTTGFLVRRVRRRWPSITWHSRAGRHS